jgi:prevent-host-death family protein
MKIATVTEAKNGLSALIDFVRSGETVLIVDRGRPVARLESAIEIEDDDGGRLARLERAGMIRIGKGGPLPDILKQPPPKPGADGDGDTSIVDILLEERRQGR